MRELIERGLIEPPEPDDPGPFAWAPEGRIAETLDAAGFDDVEVDTVEFAMRYPRGVEQWWDDDLRHVDALPRARRRARRRHAQLSCGRRSTERFARHIGPDGTLTLPARTWVAVASA